VPLILGLLEWVCARAVGEFRVKFSVGEIISAFLQVFFSSTLLSALVWPGLGLGCDGTGLEYVYANESFLSHTVVNVWLNS
jgi:hypothetical protein